MINLNFLFWNFLFLFSFIYIEYIITLIFKNFFNKTKNYSILNLKNNNFIINWKNKYIHIINILILLYFITLKITIFNNLIFFIFIYLIINQIFIFLNNNTINFINFNVIIFSFIFFFINNLITFFIYIEFYSIIYYFFFINNKNNIKIYLIQYKNSLLLYLFNNFITSILFLFTLIFVINKFGTVNFLELYYLKNIDSLNSIIYLLILSFIIKLSLPGFHFLKLEIYKYLNYELVIIFSVISLYLNYIFIFYLFNINFIFNILQTYKYLTLLIVLFFFFFIQKLKINNFNEFIAYSGFATNNLIMLNYLI